MKKIISILLVCMVTIGFTYAQAPGVFKYQSVVRDNSGNIIASQLVKFRITLLKGSPGGTESFKEQHTTATNQFGIANLEIGNGGSQVGSIDTIQWGKADYFIKIELDPTGSSGYQIMGTTQLLSVPYALFAENSNNALNDNDKSPTNELQTLSLVANTLSISSGNSVTLPKIIAGSSNGGLSPVVTSGTGWTITHPATGTYNITFNTPFTTVPTVVAHSQFVLYYPTIADALLPCIVNVTVNGMTIFIGTPGNGNDDNSFSFIAVGN